MHRHGRRPPRRVGGRRRAYLGLAVAGFPNFFMLYGPNTNLGHNSIIFILEAAGRVVVHAVHRLARHGGSLEVSAVGPGTVH